MRSKIASKERRKEKMKKSIKTENMNGMTEISIGRKVVSKEDGSRKERKEGRNEEE